MECVHERGIPVRERLLPWVDDESVYFFFFLFRGLFLYFFFAPAKKNCAHIQPVFFAVEKRSWKKKNFTGTLKMSALQQMHTGTHVFFFFTLTLILKARKKKRDVLLLKKVDITARPSGDKERSRPGSWRRCNWRKMYRSPVEVVHPNFFFPNQTATWGVQCLSGGLHEHVRSCRIWERSSKKSRGTCSVTLLESKKDWDVWTK